MDPFLTRSICQELRSAQFLLSEVGLYHSATWAGELLEDVIESVESERARADLQNESFNGSFDPDPAFCRGRDLFETMDYDQAAEVLRTSSCDYAPFLQYYCQYLSLQKQTAEKCLDPKKFVVSESMDLGLLELEVRDACSEIRESSLLDYLLGLILIDLGQVKQARNHLCKSIQAFQCHWGAWQALSDVTLSVDNNVNPHILSSGHWMSPFARAAALEAVNKYQLALREIQQAEANFPKSRFLAELKGSVELKRKNYAKAQQCFKSALQRDPHRLNCVHLLSSALAMGDGSKQDLCRLAASAAQVDRYRPETCCTIGNYYASIKEHSKAIDYFERALKMEKNFGTAWTLYAHQLVESDELVQAKNAYSKALELNPNDVRAWYGLGQLQERLKQLPVAIQYMEKSLAATLRNYLKNGRMWIALSVLYSHRTICSMDRAIQCLRKAVDCNDTHGHAVYRLADFLHKMQRREEADVWHRRFIEISATDPKINLDDLAMSLDFVANQLISKKQFQEAYAFCEKLEALGASYNDLSRPLRADIDHALRRAAPAADDQMEVEPSETNR